MNACHGVCFRAAETYRACVGVVIFSHDAPVVPDVFKRLARKPPAGRGNTFRSISAPLR